MNLAETYIQNSINEFQKQKALGFKTIEQIDDDSLHWQPNPETNSIAIVIQHMHGNMQSRWTNLLSEDGEKPWRKRDEEFIDQQFSRIELLNIWEEGWTTLFNSLNILTDEDLQKTISIRQQNLPVIAAINRQLTHYSYHVGQIVCMGKILKGADWQNLSMPKKS